MRTLADDDVSKLIDNGPSQTKTISPSYEASSTTRQLKNNTLGETRKQPHITTKQLSKVLKKNGPPEQLQTFQLQNQTILISKNYSQKTTPLYGATKGDRSGPPRATFPDRLTGVRGHPCDRYVGPGAPGKCFLYGEESEWSVTAEVSVRDFFFVLPRVPDEVH